MRAVEDGVAGDAEEPSYRAWRRRLPMPIGVRAAIDAERGHLSLREGAVA